MRILYISLSVAFLSLCIFSCRKTSPTNTVQDLPVYTDSSYLHFFAQNTGITAGTGASSIPLSDGTVLWLFGSSHSNDFNLLNQTIACQPNLHNAAMLQNGNQITSINTSTDFIPSSISSTWYEPLHGYQFGDTVFIFVKKFTPSIQSKTYVAKFSFPSLSFIKVDSFSTNQSIYGYSVIADTSEGFCYVYGAKPIGNEYAIYMLRYPMNNMYALWDYRAGDIWLNPPSSAVAIETSPSEFFSIIKLRSKFVLFTKEQGDVCNSGQHVYSSLSSYPYGPFLNAKTIFTASEKLYGATPIISKIAMHKQSIAENALLVTYATNGFDPCFSLCNNNEKSPDFYRVKSIRIPLRNIDPSW
ncbi:MAG: hypothetical protein R2831_03075 [Chitinophagaceae bacterium]